MCWRSSNRMAKSQLSRRKKGNRESGTGHRRAKQIALSSSVALTRFALYCSVWQFNCFVIVESLQWVLIYGEIDWGLLWPEGSSTRARSGTCVWLTAELVTYIGEAHKSCSTCCKFDPEFAIECTASSQWQIKFATSKYLHSCNCVLLIGWQVK